jgi:protein-disulfide isomerase/Tfp pilus assembly protein PilF
MIGWIPREILERPVVLRHDVGNVHEKVTTSSPEAQAFYDQGLNYLASYVWIEAARSFHQALRLDAKLAAAYAGLCEVYINLQDLPAARFALDKARELSSAATELERQKIEIRTRLLEFLEDKQNLQKFVAYRKAIYDGLMAYPSDPGLWILRGFADEGPGAGRGQTGDVDTIAFYQRALAISPSNSAAHHFLAHSFENIGRTEEALSHSEVYLQLASSIPHAHHMRGHELRRAGRIEEAIEEFRKANDLENAYYRLERILPEYDWHRAHNLTLLAACHFLLGQVHEAERLLKEAFALPAHSELGEFARKEWPDFLLARSRAREAFEQAQLLLKSPFRMTRFAGHVLAGRALLVMNRPEETANELVAARNELILISESDADRLRPYSEVLRAELLLSQKSVAEGATLMRQLEEQLTAAPGPDVRSQALVQLDSIARRARETQEWALAEFTAQQMIRLDPSYAGGYYALGLVAEQRADSALAAQQFGIAEKLWSEADNDLPELHVVRQKLASTTKQSILPQSRQEYLKTLRDNPQASMPLPGSKVEVSFDPARLRGNSQAPVIVVEFSDFQCPFCRKIQATLNNLLAKYQDQVGLAYRDFPLRGMHSQAESAAESSRCAGEQGKFWEYHDLLFGNPDKLTQSGLIALAQTAKLDERQFVSCLSSGKYRADVERDLQDGIRAGVMGTPGIFINGRLLSGAQPEELYERMVREDLASAKRRVGNQ